MADIKDERCYKAIIILWFGADGSMHDKREREVLILANGFDEAVKKVNEYFIGKTNKEVYALGWDGKEAECVNVELRAIRFDERLHVIL